jgi:hypothetical protein
MHGGMEDVFTDFSLLTGTYATGQLAAFSLP